jgi:hypothetical protein
MLVAHCSTCLQQLTTSPWVLVVQEQEGHPRKDRMVVCHLSDRQVHRWFRLPVAAVAALMQRQALLLGLAEMAAPVVVVVAITRGKMALAATEQPAKETTVAQGTGIRILKIVPPVVVVVRAVPV